MIDYLDMTQNKSYILTNCIKKFGCGNTIDYTMFSGLHYDAKRRGQESFQKFSNSYYGRCFHKCKTNKSKQMKDNQLRPGDIGYPSSR
jgi:hypothetical protein